MPAPRKYPNELRERARRLVAKATAEAPSLSLNAAVSLISDQPHRCHWKHVALGTTSTSLMACVLASEHEKRLVGR